MAKDDPTKKNDSAKSSKDHPTKPSDSGLVDKAKSGKDATVDDLIAPVDEPGAKASSKSSSAKTASTQTTASKKSSQSNPKSQSAAKANSKTETANKRSPQESANSASKSKSAGKGASKATKSGASRSSSRSTTTQATKSGAVGKAAPASSAALVADVVEETPPVPATAGNGAGKTRRPRDARPIPATAAAATAGAATASAGVPPEATEEDAPSYRFLVFNALPSWFVSMIVHAALIIMLAVFTLPMKEDTALNVESIDRDEVEEIEEFVIEEISMVDDMVLDSFDTPDSNDMPQQFEQLDEMPEVSDSIENPYDTIDVSSFADQTAPLDSIRQRSGSAISNDLSSRSNSERRRLSREGGGSDASEQAVMLALEWIAAHQREDGGWDFDHTRGPGGHRTSPNPGEAIRARNAATGLALLPFLGAGQTHLEGNYKEVVADGLRYLIRNQQPSAGAGSFHQAQGNMYGHGICAIALTEAYAMTNDRDLLNPAQAAINFIVYAQDPTGGGWRYTPRVGGDTSVVGWQLMALKSGYMGYLEVPPNTIRNAERFLDSVSMDSGSYYGYTGPGKGKATTACGLLSRMYLGWDQDHPSLVRGVEFLSELGPSKTGKVDMYYNYYATQVMRHYGGEEWEKWNEEMRDWLISQQATAGNMKGSWFFDHNWSNRGGRLYNTAMACMVLEVYYRHLPIYREQAADEEFPLD